MIYIRLAGRINKGFWIVSRMPDYQRKADLLNSGLVSIVSKMRKAQYKDYLRHSSEDKVIFDLPFDMPIEDADLLFDILNSTPESQSDLKECDRILHANYERTKRLKNRIAKLLESPCLFLTFTFNDKILLNTSSKTRRVYVRNFLEPLGAYVANVDFGAENGREHYHAILQTDEKIDYTAWTKGALNGERIRKPNSVKLSKYISKLVNHAIKETTKQCRIIYSR